jgi:DNA-directed RNA polymerase subunit H (RpoH/RPB5)
MKIEKHRDALGEVSQTIKDALDDPKGIVIHQRRLMSMLSLGTAQVVEIYLHRLDVMKPGAQIKHEWLKKDEKNALLRLSSALTISPGKIPKIGEILALAREIEADRDEIVYGSPMASDKALKEKIDLFLELKKAIGE